MGSTKLQDVSPRGEITFLNRGTTMILLFSDETQVQLGKTAEQILNMGEGKSVQDQGVKIERRKVAPTRIRFTLMKKGLKIIVEREGIRVRAQGARRV